MPDLPRIVVACLSEPHGASACTMALLAAMRSRGCEVQHFRSLAAFTPVDYVTPVTGIASRHIDPWIMPESLCRELFAHSAAPVDISVVEACASDGVLGPGDDPPGDSTASWRDVARILNAPVVGVVRSQPAGSFHATPLPRDIDALFIDGVASREHFDAEKSALESLHGIPVCGGMAETSHAADCAARMRAARRVPSGMIEDLAKNLLRFTRVDRLLALASSRPFPELSQELFREPGSRRAVRIAFAFDDCFHCYFPDTLDALEFLGADVSLFSPLRDERLPADTDILYLGCGHPETHARELAENECMRAAIRQHVCTGLRVYAEGGGAAYLCQQIQLADGAAVPMVGVFPAAAQVVTRVGGRPRAVTLDTNQPTWMTNLGQTIRGYTHGRWRIEPRGPLKPCFSSPSADAAGFVRHHCVGSTVHLNFAAQPRVLKSFFAPHAPSLAI